MRGAGLVLAALVSSAGAGAQVSQPVHWSGDLGLGVERTQSSAPGASARTWVLPYAYGDLGRLFVREDTVGARLVPLAWGALELVARVSTEGSEGDGPGLAHRSNPRPVGLGTFQETPWGGVFIDAFVDTNSGGTLLEASYAGELVLGRVTLYPQVGVARRSARYVGHLVGITPAAARATGQPAYAPGASTTPVFQLSGELPLAGAWVLLAHAQVEAFDRALRDSPRVASRSRSSALVALAWRFQ
jgi:outer membrane protein